MRGIWGKMLGLSVHRYKTARRINEEQYPQAAKYYCPLCYKRLFKKKDLCGEKSTKLSKAMPYSPSIHDDEYPSPASVRKLHGVYTAH